MTNNEAIEEIKSMGLIIDAMTHGTRRKSIYEALNLAIKAVEVVEKIKKACYSNENDFIDAVWDILCEAYGTEEDRESWLKEGENE